MWSSKKTRFITFIKFLIMKAKKTTFNSRHAVSKNEIRSQWSTFSEDFPCRDRDEMNMSEGEVESHHTKVLVTLPDHLIVEHILPRLPAKSVIRFKSVSKNWLSAISIPRFAKSHLKCASFRTQFLLFEDYDSTDRLHMYLLHCDGYTHNVKDLVPLPFIDDGRYPAVDLVGSCNGLLCLFLMELRGSFFVWNPATHQHRYIPSPYCQELITGYGFGYVPSIDDYKIVASYSSVLNRETGCFFVYSSKAGEWKRISSLDRSPYAGQLTRFRGVLIGDTLYWPIRHSKGKGIVGFNLVEEQLNEVPRIDWLSEDDNVVIFGLQGCSSLYCYKCDDISDIWTLKRQGVSSSWETLFSVDLKGMSILDVTKNGKYLVHHRGKVKVLDPSQEDFGRFQAGIDFHGQILETCAYADTLIPPFGLVYYNARGTRRL